MLSPVVFSILLISVAVFFTFHAKKIRRNILIGKDVDLSGNKGERLKTMLKVAFGQSKMVVRPIPGIMHFFIYAAFVITQIELLEIVIDGVSGGHRRIWHAIDGTAFSGLYTFTINFIKLDKLQLYIIQDDSDQNILNSKILLGGGSAGHNGIIDIYKYCLNWNI